MSKVENRAYEFTREMLNGTLPEGVEHHAIKGENTKVEIISVKGKNNSYILFEVREKESSNDIELTPIPDIFNYMEDKKIRLEDSWVSGVTERLDGKYGKIK